MKPLALLIKADPKNKAAWAAAVQEAKEDAMKVAYDWHPERRAALEEAIDETIRMLASDGPMKVSLEGCADILRDAQVSLSQLPTAITAVARSQGTPPAHIFSLGAMVADLGTALSLLATVEQSLRDTANCKHEHEPAAAQA